MLNAFGALEGEDPDLIIHTTLDMIQRQTPTNLLNDETYYKSFENPNLESLKEDDRVFILGDCGIFSEYTEEEKEAKQKGEEVQKNENKADVFSNTNQVISIPFNIDAKNKTFLLISGILVKEFHYVAFVINKLEENYRIDIYGDDLCFSFNINLDEEKFDVKRNEITADFFIYRTFYQVTGEKQIDDKEYEKEMFLQIDNVTNFNKLSNNFIEVLTMEQAQFVLAHLEHYKDQTPELEEKLKKHINKLNMPGEKERLQSLIEEPEKMLTKKTTNNTTKFFALTRQRKQLIKKLSIDIGKNLVKEHAAVGFITRERYEYNEIVFTTGGDCIITYTPQINSPVVAMELTNEQLNKVQGIQGLEEYMKRAILIFAFNIKNHTNFFRLNAEQLAHDFPPQDGETEPLTQEKLIKDVKDWWSHNTVELQGDGTAKVKPKVRATVIKPQVDVLFVVYSTGGFETKDSEYKIKFVIKYDILKKGTEEKIEDRCYETDEQLTSIDQVIDLICEDILDHAICADQTTVIEFRYKYPHMVNCAIFDHDALIRWKRLSDRTIVIHCKNKTMTCKVENKSLEEIKALVEEKVKEFNIPENIPTKICGSFYLPQETLSARKPF